MARKLPGKLGEGIKALNAALKRPLGSFKRGRSEETPPKSREADRLAAKKKPDTETAWPDLPGATF